MGALAALNGGLREESMRLPTMLAGSYAEPEWLIDRARLPGRFSQRMRARELWRIPEPYLAEAQNDATLLAIKAQEEAGLDIITDGEIRRESYSSRIATTLNGIDIVRAERAPQSHASAGHAFTVRSDPL